MASSLEEACKGLSDLVDLPPRTVRYDFWTRPVRHAKRQLDEGEAEISGFGIVDDQRQLAKLSNRSVRKVPAVTISVNEVPKPFEKGTTKGAEPSNGDKSAIAEAAQALGKNVRKKAIILRRDMLEEGPCYLPYLSLVLWHEWQHIAVIGLSEAEAKAHHAEIYRGQEVLAEIVKKMFNAEYPDEGRFHELGTDPRTALKLEELCTPPGWAYHGIDEDARDHIRAKYLDTSEWRK